jgi:hypothetical protein
VIPRCGMAVALTMTGSPIMNKKKKKKQEPSGSTTGTEEPPLPAYDEGYVESVHGGRGQGEDEDRMPPPPDEREQEPKRSGQPDVLVQRERDRPVIG